MCRCFLHTRGVFKADRSNITLYKFPDDEKLLQQWKAQIYPHREETNMSRSETPNGLSWVVKRSDRVCSLHFRGGRKLGENNVPTIFDNTNYTKKANSHERSPMMETETNEEDPIVIETFTKPAEERIVETPNKKPVEKLKRQSLKVDDPVDEDDSEEKTEIDIRAEYKGPDMERQPSITENRNREDSETAATNDNVKFKVLFDIEDFRDDDAGIKHYTGLPDYQTFVALYNFVKPREGYQLNYHNNKKQNVARKSSVNDRGRPRTLSAKNELFLTLCRLRRNLAEMDLHYRFGISTKSVSETFLTWLDRLDYCLGSLDQIPGLDEGLSQLLPESFKGGFEDIDLIIDCTEVWIQKPSDPIAQSATWSEYKGHNTGKILVGVTPVGFPRFVSDVYPGSISDDDITGASGILSLARRNKRWLADKGWQCNGDKFGLIIETPDRLEGKMQFSEAEDVANRKISRLRIHVERLIRRIKVYKMCSTTIPIRYVNVSSKIFKVCARLTAFLPPLIKDTDISILNEE